MFMKLNKQELKKKIQKNIDHLLLTLKGHFDPEK